MDGDGPVAAIGVAGVDARVVGARVLREVDLVASVVQVPRAAEAARAHNGAVDAGHLDAERWIVHVVALDRLDVRAVPRFRAVVVY